MNKPPIILGAISARLRWGLTFGLIITLIGIANGCAKSDSGAKTGNKEQLDRYYSVERGAFNIKVLARGELDAIKNHELRFDGKGKEGLRIEQMVKDKSKVKAGAAVVSFASDPYTEKITLLEQEIHDLKVNYVDRLKLEDELFEENTRNLNESLEDAELNISLFLESQSVARDKSISVLTEASNAYETAKDALNKYKNLEFRTLSKQKQADIDLKEQEYYDLIDELNQTEQELSEARLKDEDTREKAERNVTLASKKANSALTAWETSRKSDRRFRRYDHPQTLRKLLITAEKTELDLKRYLVKAESDRVQGERQYRKLLRDKHSLEDQLIQCNEKYTEELERLKTEYQTNYERSNERLIELQDDLKGLILTAPVDGIVTLGQPSKQGKPGKELDIGASVAPKELVARIPDLSQFLVRCNIPEIYRSRISLGQSALLKNAALPGLKMQGDIISISSMSQRLIRWDPRSPRTYETIINTDNSDPRLMPGMTVEVEIHVDTVDGVLYIPIESIYNKEGKSYCKVKDGNSTIETEIQTGRSSDSFVEITQGLKEGQEVLLHALVSPTDKG